jgi:hypothetical protein
VAMPPPSKSPRILKMPVDNGCGKGLQYLPANLRVSRARYEPTGFFDAPAGFLRVRTDG